MIKKMDIMKVILAMLTLLGVLYLVIEHAKVGLMLVIVAFGWFLVILDRWVKAPMRDDRETRYYDRRMGKKPHKVKK